MGIGEARQAFGSTLVADVTPSDALVTLFDSGEEAYLGLVFSV